MSVDYTFNDLEQCAEIFIAALFHPVSRQLSFRQLFSRNVAVKIDITQFIKTETVCFFLLEVFQCSRAHHFGSHFIANTEYISCTEI